MYLYNEEGKRLRYDTFTRIGGEEYGNVFKISEDVCLKVYKRGKLVNKEILMFIKNLKLKNFYEIYEFLYNKSGDFKAHTMKYYLPEEVDILTMPVDYTLDNLYNLFISVSILTDNNIFVSDMHTGNAVIDYNNITVIDTDIYTFNQFFSVGRLEQKNLFALRYLFTEIYMESLIKFHSDLSSYINREQIGGIFSFYDNISLDKTYKKLSRYKYPIDYLIKSNH